MTSKIGLHVYNCGPATVARLISWLYTWKFCKLSGSSCGYSCSSLSSIASGFSDHGVQLLVVSKQFIFFELVNDESHSIHWSVSPGRMFTRDCAIGNLNA